MEFPTISIDNCNWDGMTNLTCNMIMQTIPALIFEKGHLMKGWATFNILKEINHISSIHDRRSREAFFTLARIEFTGHLIKNTLLDHGKWLP